MPAAEQYVGPIGEYVYGFFSRFKCPVCGENVKRRSPFNFGAVLVEIGLQFVLEILWIFLAVVFSSILYRLIGRHDGNAMFAALVMIVSVLIIVDRKYASYTCTSCGGTYSRQTLIVAAGAQSSNSSAEK